MRYGYDKVMAVLGTVWKFERLEHLTSKKGQKKDSTELRKRQDISFINQT